MTPYPHPAVNLAIFKARLSQDIGVDDSTYTLTCAAPIPTDSGLYDAACQDVADRYNSMVDMVAAGSLIGEVDQYLYNRLDLAQLQLPVRTFKPYLKGTAQTVVDLLPQINARSGLHLQPQDIEAYAIPAPSGCDCSCGPSSVPLAAAPTSLLFIGQFPLYVFTEPMPLPGAVLQIFLPPVNLAPLTP